MRIRLIAVGHKMPKWVVEGYDEYAKRLPKDFALELLEIPMSPRGKNTDIAKAIRKEGDLMLEAIPSSDKVIAMEVLGKEWSTDQLADQTEQWRMDGYNVSLLVGGPDGLDPRCTARADQVWSLSRLTLPHPMVRILLAEQIYRAWTLMNNHPYHR
ncbi:23S rRNA (pseudouridine(1915)-N(3))-methyltransferase RlmH [Marinomonas hwangdonensis]|uniref:Ribosomal RNA large subunit methyltransferase H n=1 Tax=Marinomonas hwangdonensis TaxID=1053647 RepID=A0A3M8Q4C8_9GAMM|nr:23S rRNA (pseudouridine(1915)-N(3))-methyltransferase RlmH [Marinomonas hwangdonensis]MDP5057049.1 23S rRNA (pseudouridine(1915)-N(3))-methyltransferase RlmH [Marinomonas hwangdonensis]RNF50988.1 23S rRNA (pseudouridine(1915)-N(3))-methyltransferase RlmH [Marinomonas hwangdonensis]